MIETDGGSVGPEQHHTLNWGQAFGGKEPAAEWAGLLESRTLTYIQT